MIHSMTGYGAAEVGVNGASFAVEIRSLNHRYLKITTKLPDRYQFFEPEVERLLRGKLSRGAVTFTLKARGGSTESTPVNVGSLQELVRQLGQVQTPKNVQASIDLAVLAQLPGVSESDDLDESKRAELSQAFSALTEKGLGALIHMRREEGRTLRADLLECCKAIQAELEKVAARAPSVVNEYHERLRSRVAELLRSAEFQLQQDALAREVAIYAERSDISEEVNRLGAHVAQFRELCDQGSQVGRTMDFLAQEMLREANTIGSKSNDVTIARSVVTLKGWIDRLKEQVQNVE